jgi:hypothetical protein
MCAQLVLQNLRHLKPLQNSSATAAAVDQTVHAWSLPSWLISSSSTCVTNPVPLLLLLLLLRLLLLRLLLLLLRRPFMPGARQAGKPAAAEPVSEQARGRCRAASAGHWPHGSHPGGVEPQLHQRH